MLEDHLLSAKNTLAREGFSNLLPLDIDDEDDLSEELGLI
jgi:hypothetical protein